MNRIPFGFFSVICVLASILLLGSNSKYARAQTRDQVAKFDATGNPVDSVITDNSGYVGIGLPSDGRYPNNVVQIFGQDGLRITGYQPFLTLEDNNGPNRRGIIQSAYGSIFFYPDNFIGQDPAMTIDNNGDIIVGHGFLSFEKLVPTYRITLPNVPDEFGRGIANAWTTYSSRRWKENITAIDNALAKVERLRGVYYDWKENKKHDIGLIAEEVGEVVPEVVTYEKDGKHAQSLDYARLTALLVEAVKELQAENKALEGRIEALERTSSTVQARRGYSAFALASLGTLGVIGYAWRWRKRVVA